ncbi:hypothetical protein Bsp3421_002432 [Burkholderia sp. FERM BP-3421]|jgi:hypothetical protein|uniref:hypothetical protein n=1 Tax=Burkholderia sp. FERM BP-3421 TaxID=1494466 RepID=UPI0023617A54|nr:hypothetical protein [Burkholderia sp. FERM BP-3421]WDD92427.1 hypothetical protein Bsp3421_002432 [Burkholderia sp. FERM BP-3421]
MTLFIFLALMVVCLVLSRYVAIRKRLNPTFWTIAGFILGPLALIAVLIAPSKA